MTNLTTVNNKKMLKLATAITLSIAAVSSAYAHADNEKVIEQEISLEGASQFHLEANVGSVKLIPSTDGQIHVYVKVSEKAGWGIFKDKPADAKLNIERANGKVIVSLNDDEYGEEWKVSVPQVSLIDADLGVGEMESRGINSNLKLDVGVGEATVIASANAYMSAKGQAGVGAADVRSATGKVYTDRAMVSEEVSWSGKGEYSIDVEVGVGDISIKLN